MRIIVSGIIISIFFDSVLFYFLHFYCRDRMYCKLCDVRFLSCFSSLARVLHISFHDMIGNMQNVRCWLIFAVSAPGVVAGIISRYCYCHAVFRILSRRNLPSLACGFLVCTDERLHHSVQRKVNAIPVCREWSLSVCVLCSKLEVIRFRKKDRWSELLYKWLIQSHSVYSHFCGSAFTDSFTKPVSCSGPRILTFITRSFQRYFDN